MADEPNIHDCIMTLVRKAAAAPAAHEARDYAQAAHTVADTQLAMQHHDRQVEDDQPEA